MNLANAIRKQQHHYKQGEYYLVVLSKFDEFISENVYELIRTSKDSCEEQMLKSAKDYLLTTYIKKYRPKLKSIKGGKE